MWGNSHDLMSQIASSSVTFMTLPNGRTFRHHTHKCILVMTFTLVYSLSMHPFIFSHGLRVAPAYTIAHFTLSLNSLNSITSPKNVQNIGYYTPAHVIHDITLHNTPQY